MTASDLHQRMLHLLDRAKAMSGPSTAARTVVPSQQPPASLQDESSAYIPDVAPAAEMDQSGSADGITSVSSDPADTRTEARHKVLRKGKITYGNGAFEVECQLRDLNTTGAKLKLSGDVTVPSSFEITIYPEKMSKTAQVCWRDELMLGIRFIDN
jgi:hypothetical protein